MKSPFKPLEWEMQEEEEAHQPLAPFRSPWRTWSSQNDEGRVFGLRRYTGRSRRQCERLDKSQISVEIIGRNAGRRRGSGLERRVTRRLCSEEGGWDDPRTTKTLDLLRKEGNYVVLYGEVGLSPV